MTLSAMDACWHIVEITGARHRDQQGKSPEGEGTDTPQIQLPPPGELFKNASHWIETLLKTPEPHTEAASSSASSSSRGRQGASSPSSAARERHHQGTLPQVPPVAGTVEWNDGQSALYAVRLAAASALPPGNPCRSRLVSLAASPWSLSDALAYDLDGQLGSSFAEWELLQATLISRISPHLGLEGLWCFNPHCTNLSGPSELQLETQACQGGCGARYCSEACQEQCWRMGHRKSCVRLASNARHPIASGVGPGSSLLEVVATRPEAIMFAPPEDLSSSMHTRPFFSFSALPEKKNLASCLRTLLGPMMPPTVKICPAPYHMPLSASNQICTMTFRCNMPHC